jgi:hypothetical protein
VHTITLRSRDFDAYLIVYDDLGKELARDDDSGGDLDAQIMFRAPYTGTYYLVATTFSRGEMGRYRLHVTP